ncbi:hypothetical protein C8F04DRAFT_1172260 [Mycena alexandri]|uniref:Uncharacterized protein n=1 Tax=Mycena alexandri TaxID=1745969 RepID=A0AAD6XF65_9AGAR|nr:hypothetical protein C8F04DRAFT_1172260 [Mycena alexandri]
MSNTEGSDDMPPIAFLREPTQSASPEFRPRSIPNDSPPKAKAVQSSHSLPSGPFTFTSRPAPPPSSAPPSRATLAPAQPSSSRLGVSPVQMQPPTRPSSVARDALPRRHKDTTARTRAATGASAHEPAPRYKYTYNSLMRRPAATGHAPSRGADYGAPARQRELDVVCELTPATAGTLGRKLEADEPAIAAALFERLAERMEVEAVGAGAFAPWPRWIEPRPTTAPTATYAAILVETFGPGSILRGEGAKPLQPTNKQRKSVTVKSSTGSRASTSDLDVEMDVDTDGSASDCVSAEEIQARARDWITEIQTVAKGKRQLTREDLRALAATLKQIQNMDVAEGRALGEEGLRLQHSLRQLAQLDPQDIPFRDEHRPRKAISLRGKKTARYRYIRLQYILYCLFLREEEEGGHGRRREDIILINQFWVPFGAVTILPSGTSEGEPDDIDLVRGLNIRIGPVSGRPKSFKRHGTTLPDKRFGQESFTATHLTQRRPIRIPGHARRGSTRNQNSDASRRRDSTRDIKAQSTSLPSSSSPLARPNHSFNANAQKEIYMIPFQKSKEKSKNEMVQVRYVWLFD